MKILTFFLFLIGINYSVLAQGESSALTASATDEPPLISAGMTGPDWKLPVLTTRWTNVALDIERGRVVLVDFWTKNSAPCIALIPRLNALQAKYKADNVEVLGINCNDDKKDVVRFYTKYRPHYRIAMDGKEIAEKYGVTGYPTVVLLGKNGKVLYAGNWDETKVKALIEKAL